MIQETGKRHNGAAAAILTDPFPRVDILRGVVCGGFAAADTPYVVARASFAPIHHSKQPFSYYQRPKSLALVREAYSGTGLFKSHFLLLPTSMKHAPMFYNNLKGTRIAVSAAPGPFNR